MADRDTAHFRGAGGAIWPMDLPLPENMQEQLIKGYLTRVNEDGSPYVEASATVEPPEEEKPPAANASKAVWVGFAHRVHGVSIDDAEALTKHDLMELYGPKV